MRPASQTGVAFRLRLWGADIGRLFAIVMLAAASSVAASAASQSGTAPPPDKKPNIAVSGCMMRQGYANFRLEDARVDAIGDKAATAEPVADKRGEGPKTPARWVLDNAGTAAQRVGQKVQVTGISDWVTHPEEYSAGSTDPGPPLPMPRIDVLSLKVLAPQCS